MFGISNVLEVACRHHYSALIAWLLELADIGQARTKWNAEAYLAALEASGQVEFDATGTPYLRTS